MNCNHKTFHVLMGSMKAVVNELNDPSVNDILCTSDEGLEIGRRENVLLLRFMEVKHSGALFSRNTGNLAEHKLAEILTAALMETAA